MTTLAVTGAAGFIGRHLLDRARRDHDRLVGLDLAPPPAALVDQVRWVTADLADPAALDAAFAGCDVVVHAAAIVAEDGDRDRFITVNVDGSRRVAEAAARCGVGRLVHVSSIVVYGDRRPPGELTPESAPLTPTGAPYTDTKIAAEHAVLAVASEHRLAVTIVRPGDVIGPGSVPWVERPCELLRRGRFVLVDGGRWPMSPVHVDDVVDGILLAAVLPQAAGRAYNLAGPPVPARRFFAVHAGHVGTRLRSVPRPVALGAAHLAVRVAGLTRRPAPFAPAAVEYVTHRGGYATDRARAELDWQPRTPWEPGLRAALAGVG